MARRLSYEQEFNRAFDAVRPQIEESSLGKIMAVVLFGSLSHSAPRMDKEEPDILESDVDLLVVTTGSGDRDKDCCIGQEIKFGKEERLWHKRRPFSRRIPHASINVETVEGWMSTLNYFLTYDCSPKALERGVKNRVFYSGQQLWRMVMVQAFMTGIVIEGTVPKSIADLAHLASQSLTDIPHRQILKEPIFHF